MEKYTDQLISSLKERIDIPSLLAEFSIDWKVRGDELFMQCPFHAETTPSLSFNLNSKVFHCFGCGESGDVISFVMKFKHIGFKEAIEFLNSLTGNLEEVKIEVHDRVPTRKQFVNIVKIGKQRIDNMLSEKALPFNTHKLRLFVLSDLVFSFFLYMSKNCNANQLPGLYKDFLDFFENFQKKMKTM